MAFVWSHATATLRSTMGKLLVVAAVVALTWLSISHAKVQYFTLLGAPAPLSRVKQQENNSGRRASSVSSKRRRDSSYNNSFSCGSGNSTIVMIRMMVMLAIVILEVVL